MKSNKSIKYKNSLIVDIIPEEITISLKDGPEVVKWVQDEWIEDKTLLPIICHAIRMAYTNPQELIDLHQKHIDSQKQIAINTK